MVIGVLSIFPLSFTVFAQTQRDWLTYENPDYGISIEYPANWIKQESDLPRASPVAFATSEPNILVIPNATLAVFVYTPKPEVSSLEEYVSIVETQNAEKVQSGDQRMVNTSYTTLSGFPAWSEVFYNYETGRNIKTLITLTLTNNQVYELDYRAQPGEYDRFMPTVQRMLDSFHIANNSNIASAEQRRPQTDQSTQTTGSNLTTDLYGRCLEISGKDICDFMFQK